MARTNAGRLAGNVAVGAGLGYIAGQAAVSVAQKHAAKARSKNVIVRKSNKSITAAHAGRTGASPSRTTKTNARGGKNGRKGAPLRGAGGKFAGWSS